MHVHYTFFIIIFLRGMNEWVVWKRENLAIVLSYFDLHNNSEEYLFNLFLISSSVKGELIRKEAHGRLVIFVHIVSKIKPCFFLFLHV